MTDRLTAYVNHVKEPRSAVLVKLLAWLFFVLYVAERRVGVHLTSVPSVRFPISFHNNTKRYWLTRHIFDVFFSLAFLIYSFAYYFRVSASRRLV